MTHVRQIHLGACSSPWCPSCERPNKTNSSRNGACISNDMLLCRTTLDRSPRSPHYHLCESLVSSALDPDEIHWRPPGSTKEHCVRKCGIHWKLCRIHCPTVSLLFDHHLTIYSQHLKPIGSPRQSFALMARRRRRGARRRTTHTISTSDGAPVVRLYPAISIALLRNFLENPNCVHCTDSDDIEWTEEVGRRCHWCQRPICFRHSHSRYWWQCHDASSCWKVCEKKQIYSQSQQ